MLLRLIKEYEILNQAKERFISEVLNMLTVSLYNKTFSFWHVNFSSFSDLVCLFMLSFVFVLNFDLKEIEEKHKG